MTEVQPNQQIESDLSRTLSAKLAQAFRALRYKNFQLFLGGQLISLVGTWMQQVAQSWLIYRLTGSSLLLGTLSFAGQVPVFLIAPLGGIVADRYNRQRIVIATQTASMLLALILAWLTLTNRVAVWHVVALSALLGVVNAFDIPARQAFLVHMVGKADLMNAIALNSSMFNSARMIGPAVAGVMVALMGEGWCFFANGISYLAVIAGLLMMRITLVPREAQTTSPLENILEGFRFARNSPPIRMLLLMLALCSLVATPYTVLMPIFAGEILHGGPRGLGALMGATGIGALLAAMILAARTELRGLGRWIVWASGGFGVSLVLFAFSRSFWLSMGLLIPTGFALMLQMGATNTLLQSMTPDRMRGRVMAIYSMMFMGMAPFGALLAGAAAHRFGAPATVATGGLMCIGAAIYYSRQLPSIREEARRLILAQEKSSQS